MPCYFTLCPSLNSRTVAFSTHRRCECSLVSYSPRWQYEADVTLWVEIFTTLTFRAATQRIHVKNGTRAIDTFWNGMKRESSRVLATFAEDKVHLSKARAKEGNSSHRKKRKMATIFLSRKCLTTWEMAPVVFLFDCCSY